MDHVSDYDDVLISTFRLRAEPAEPKPRPQTATRSQATPGDQFQATKKAMGAMREWRHYKSKQGCPIDGGLGMGKPSSVIVRLLPGSQQGK